MKTKLLLSALLSFSFYLLSSQVPQGFNYQAIARDGSYSPIINQTLKVEITVQSDSLGSIVLWKEWHSSVTTNSLGLFTIVLGRGVRQSGLPKFSDINWSVSPVFINTKIEYPVGSWKNMGTTRLWSVPYSMNSGGISGTLKKLTVKGETTSSDSILFEVKNKTGQTVFAVYNKGVRIYVDTTKAATKGTTKGGFAIGSFGDAKTPSQEFFRVTRDSTRVYVNPLAKGITKGGFAIGGFSGKGTENNFLNLTKENYFIGQASGSKNITGIDNAFIGTQTGYSNSSGSNNIFIGNQSGYSNSAGYNNIFIGYHAGLNANANTNSTFIGNEAGRNITGDDNIAIGDQAGTNNYVTNAQMFGITILGIDAGRNVTGDYNTFLGYGSGSTFSGAGNGMNNTFVGAQAGSGTLSDKNVCLGYKAGYNQSGSNKLYIANNEISPLIYGEFDTKKLKINGVLAVNSDNPNNYKLISVDNLPSDDNPAVLGQHNVTANYGVGVKGIGGWYGVIGDASNPGGVGSRTGVLGSASGGTINYGIYGSAPVAVSSYAGYFAGNVNYTGAITNTSDKTLKKNILPLSGSLQKVLNLQGVTYEWKSESELTSAGLNKKGTGKGTDIPSFNFPKGSQFGVIAQDVEKILPELVQTDIDGLKSVDYIKMIPLLIEAIKDQQKQIDELKATVNSLSGQVKK